jgi:uncharacterized membrane protein YhfC
MSGIFGMAVLTICVTAAFCKLALDHLTHSDQRYYGLLLAGLPLSLIVNRFVKIPLIGCLAALTGSPLKLGPTTPVWFIAAIWLNAPLFEEAIKSLPVLIPLWRRLLNEPLQALWAGFALGMGFGLGEAAYLAYGIAYSPAYNQMPWYMFTGFATERFAVTFAHGLMTSVFALGLHYGGRKGLAGYLTSVGLHALINLGPILLAVKVIPAAVSSIGIYSTILLAFLIFQKNDRFLRKTSGIEPVEIIYFQR